MIALSEAVSGKRIIVEFPLAAGDDWLAVGEVLVQERLRAWAWPVENLAELPEAMRIFGRRVAIGVCGIRTASQLADAAQLGAVFATSPVTKASFLQAKVPVAVGAWTINEVEAASELGATAVQIVPGDLVQYGYFARLTQLFPDVEIVATGQLSVSDAESALRDGCSAVCVSGETLIPSASLIGLDLDALRLRCRMYADLA